MPTYLETYPESLTLGNGLISKLSNMPWNDVEDFDLKALEMAYGMRSGFKVLTSAFTSIAEANRAGVIEALYSQKWRRLWRNYVLEYNPLDAYSVTEKGTREKNGTDNNVINYGRTITNNGTDTGTVDIDGNEQGGGTDSVFGFNSSEAVPSETNSNSSTNTNKETRNLSSSNNSVNSGRDERDITVFEQEDYNYTKTGNIGYTSPQKLLQQDMEIWQKPFFDIVFKDIDFSITVAVFDI